MQSMPHAPDLANKKLKKIAMAMQIMCIHGHISVGLKEVMFWSTAKNPSNLSVS